MAKTTVVKRPTPSQIIGQPTDAAEAVYVTMDTVTREQHDLSSTITDHPVEEGVDFSDHQRPDPDKLVLECVISNTPITAQQQLISDAVGTSTRSTKPQVRRDPARASTAYAQLKKFRDDGSLLTVTTTLRVYTDMALEHLSIPREAKNSDALEFTATFKYIRVVQNKLTRVVNAKDTRAQPQKKRGKATPQETPDDSSALGAGVDEAKGKDGVLGKAGGFLSGAGGVIFGQ